MRNTGREPVRTLPDEAEPADNLSRNGVAGGAIPPAPGRTPPPAIEAAPHGWRATFHTLRNREFRFLWLGMLFLMFGIQMQMIVRGYLAYEITSSPFILGLVNAGFAIPMLS